MSIWKNFVFWKKNTKVENKPEKKNLGASWNSPLGVQYTFPPKESLDAFGEHAYLFAALQRTTEDLAALPLQVVEGKGKNQKILEDHPVLELLENPSSDVDSFLFRQQIALDLILSGCCFVLLLGPNKTPTSIIRLHPEETKFVTDETGIIGVINSSYGQSVKYPIEKVLYARNPSYKKGPQSIYGTGATQPLFQELKSDINALLLASEASGKGRPDVLISPSDPSDVWPKETREEIVNSYRSMAKSGGAIALSGLAKIDLLNLTPRDCEYTTARTMAREAISAAIGIPPTLLGMPDANYATSMQQKKTYWNNQRMRAIRFDHLFTKLARLYDPNIRVQHSFIEIESLSNRDQQLARVKIHIENGMNPIDAYIYEGLSDAPFKRMKEESDETIIDDSQKDILINFFQKNTDQRRKEWLKWIEKKQGPAEVEFLEASIGYLKKSKNLIMRKFKTLKSKSIITIHNDPFTYFERDIRLTGDMISREEKNQLMNDTIEKVFVKNFSDTKEEELKQIFNKAKKKLNVEVTTSEEETGKFLSRLNDQLMRTTLKETNKIINKGIEEGLSVQQIQRNIENSKIFNEGRAKRIARTEATKCINNATLQAQKIALDNDIVLFKEWRSERDGEVRPAHQDLDGQIVDINDEFVVPVGTKYAGESASSPGNFGVEGLDVNCRCFLTSDVQIQE